MLEEILVSAGPIDWSVLATKQFGKTLISLDYIAYMIYNYTVDAFGEDAYENSNSLQRVQGAFL